METLTRTTLSTTLNVCTTKDFKNYFLPLAEHCIYKH